MGFLDSAMGYMSKEMEKNQKNVKQKMTATARTWSDSQLREAYNRRYEKGPMAIEVIEEEARRRGIS